MSGLSNSAKHAPKTAHPGVRNNASNWNAVYFKQIMTGRHPQHLGMLSAARGSA
jgi:hypothetical protein